MTKEKVKKPVYKRWWFIVVVGFFTIGIIGSIFSDEEEAAVPPVAEVVADPPEPVDEKTLEEVVKESVETHFGEGSVEQLTYNEDVEFVLIKVIGKDNLTVNLIKGGMTMDSAKVLEDLDGVEGLSTVDFNIVFPLQDKYGEESNEIVMKLSVDAETRERINWDNFSHNDLPDVSADYWEHPAFAD